MWDPRGRRCQTPSNIVHCKKDKIKILLPLKLYSLNGRQQTAVNTEHSLGDIIAQSRL